MIWLVGAGPGDSGLLTLRGKEVLSRADVVIYDRLVGDGILAMLPEDAELIDAGKSPYNHTFTQLTQREIEAVMIARAREGKNVVRLKGGDPFVFGRGGEEAEAIMREGLAFEVVPGVSSAVSVPAYAGIPATHREYCSGVSIITAHDRNNLVPDFTDTTLIFLMGVGNSGELQAKLMETLSPEIPCAVIQDGTTSRQRVIRTTLGRLHESVMTNRITSPAVIVVGRVAGLRLAPSSLSIAGATHPDLPIAGAENLPHDKGGQRGVTAKGGQRGVTPPGLPFSGAELVCRASLPLEGKRVIITRPSGREGELSVRLRDLGAEVIHLPTIRTTTLHGALDGVSLSGWDWVGFTSVTGVDSMFELLSESGRDVRELGNAKIAAIGRATAEALRAHGLRVDYVPEVYDGEHLAGGLARMGGRVLMLRALNGSEDIAAAFRKYGIISEHVCIYRTDYVKLVHVPKFTDTIIFTSASTVRGFCLSTKTLREVKAVCIGRQTANEALRYGFSDVVIAEQADIDSLVKAVLSCS